MEDHAERTNKLRVRSEIFLKNKSSPALCFQVGQDDLTPLTWLHSNVNIFPSVATSSSSSSSCSPVTLNNNEDLQEKILKVETPCPDPAEIRRKCPPLDQKLTAAASEEDGCLDLSENFKTEESKQLFLRNAIKISKLGLHFFKLVD